MSHLTGGAYIPPSKLARLQEKIKDKNCEEYQRLAWDSLRKKINGLSNKVNISNIGNIVHEYFKINLIRGRGLFARSVMTSQMDSPAFTSVYAALISIINTKFPMIGQLILTRLILQFKMAYRRNRKRMCRSSCKFIAHLVNQKMAHEIIALEILALLLENISSDSIEVAVEFLKEVGQTLMETSPKAMNAISAKLRDSLHENDVNERSQFMIEVFFAIRKDGFKDYPAIPQELDLISEDDKYTHVLSLDDEDMKMERMLDIFQFDEQFEENENKYISLKQRILGDDDDDDDNDDDDDDSDEEGYDDDNDDEENGGGYDGDDEKMGNEKKQVIIDQTDTNIVQLRRTIYLTIQSSLSHDECAHKLLKMQLKEDQQEEICHMITDCCAQQRIYEKFFGFLAQKFCQIRKIFRDTFEKIFEEQYVTCHRLETIKLRNTVTLYAHLLATDSIDWKILSIIKLTQSDTTSSSRIFIKILFQELSEAMGIPKLNERLHDRMMVEYFEGIFPKDNPVNTRFSINFFTAIELGALTEESRNFLKTAPRMVPTVLDELESNSSSDDDSSSSDSNSSSSSDEE
ncbi:hypothetical protein SNEBB_002422 [Seison nebaliae]|nr:hypothetical protein SNEBB_002422 [Seison nebaliae]